MDDGVVGQVLMGVGVVGQVLMSVDSDEGTGRSQLSSNMYSADLVPGQLNSSRSDGELGCHGQIRSGGCHRAM